jgi:membrane protease YdiL (CAAX protease family)
MAVAFGSHITVATFLMVIENPLAEEIIARAYVITEVEALTKSPEMAVLACFVLQFIYHLYQGIWNAVVLAVEMLCLSIFYLYTRRAIPNIFAHFYMNAWSQLFR